MFQTSPAAWSSYTQRWSLYLFSTHCSFMLIMWRVLPSEAFAAFPCITSFMRLYLYRVPSWAYISLISQNTFCWATQNDRRDLNDPAVDLNRRDSGGGSTWGISCNSEVMMFSYSEHICSVSLCSFNHSRKPLLL